MIGKRINKNAIIRDNNKITRSELIFTLNRVK